MVSKLLEFAVNHKDKGVVALFTSFFYSILYLVTKKSFQSKFDLNFKSVRLLVPDMMI